MSRPVKNDSTCARYEYFRKRYLERKAKGIKSKKLPRERMLTLKQVEQFLSRKPPKSEAGWLEISAGRSNS